MSPTPYYGPDEDAHTIFLERTFMAGDFVCGTGYGAYRGFSTPVLTTHSKPEDVAHFSLQ